MVTVTARLEVLASIDVKGRTYDDLHEQMEQLDKDLQATRRIPGWMGEIVVGLHEVREHGDGTNKKRIQE